MARKQDKRGDKGKDFAARSPARSLSHDSPHSISVLSQNPSLNLQTTFGNQRLGRLLGSFPIQAKLTLNVPGDSFEQEADHVSEQVMRMPASNVSAAPPFIQRMPRENEDKQAGPTMRAQNFSAATKSEPLPAAEATVRALDSGGEPLHAGLRSFFESRFGRSFEQVRVHTDAAAASSSKDLNALAYTRGPHIVFAPGQFEPHTQRGQRLLAHELTHVVQQGWAGRKRIQRAYLAPTPDATGIREVPQPTVANIPQEDKTPEIQRSPGPNTPAPAPTPAPALASPTITLSPSDTIVRGDTITASVAFSPTAAGETLKITGWQYTTVGGDIITRPKTGAKFQSEWKGIMAVSGNLELSYTVKPKGKPAVAGTAVTSAVTVNDRTGPAWQTTITNEAETPLSGMPSPPELANQLGLHVVPGDVEPAAGQTPISSGPNAGLIFVDSVQDRNFKSQPLIHPDVTNAASPFRIFHKSGGHLYYVPTGGVRTLVPSSDYTGLRVAGGTLTFSVPNWTAFYKKYGFFRVTVSGGGNTVIAQPSWWRLEPNTEQGQVEITDLEAVRAALGIDARTRFKVVVNTNGSWSGNILMPSAKIPAATRSHEYTHPTHSHRANLHKIVRALDPRRVLESTVSTPSKPVTFRDKIHSLLTEIWKPNHELVDEAASKAAGNFVPVSGIEMATINQDPASLAGLGDLWDITHDKKMS